MDGWVRGGGEGRGGRRHTTAVRDELFDLLLHGYVGDAEVDDAAGLDAYECDFDSCCSLAFAVMVWMVWLRGRWDGEEGRLPKRTGCIKVSSVMQCQAINATMNINKEDPETTVYLSDLSYVKTL